MNVRLKIFFLPIIIIVCGSSNKIARRAVNKDFLKFAPWWDWGTYSASSLGGGLVSLSLEAHTVNGAEGITVYTETGRRQGPSAKPLGGPISPVWYLCTFEGQFIASTGRKCFKNRVSSAFP